MIEFDFPGSETRESYGKGLKSITGQKDPQGKVLDYKGYGRKKADRFLVHVKDQQARPDMFKLVPNEIKAPEVETRPLTEPVLIAQPKKGRKRESVAA